MKFTSTNTLERFLEGRWRQAQLNTTPNKNSSNGVLVELGLDLEEVEEVATRGIFLLLSVACAPTI